VEANPSVRFIRINDLTSEENIIEMFSQINFREDELYFLYSTIGGFMSAKIEDTEYEKLKYIFGINLYSQFLLGKHFFINAGKTAGGSICFTSAYTSFKEESNKSAYGASKAALNYIVRTMALEGINNNLTANAIAPYALDTPDNRSWIEKTINLISPEKVAEKVDYIFRSYREINGQIIRMPEIIA
jgi:NAD(P)-dependent dehydrogenase (short-subunit alcohol dehydrogenase family)